MSKQHKVLVEQRKGYVMNVQKQLNLFDTVKSNPDSPDSSDTLSNIVDKLKLYNEKLENLNTDSLNSIDDDDDMSNEVITSSEFREKIIDAIHSAGTLLTKRLALGSTQYDEAADTASLGLARAGIKLPKLEIEVYSGDPLKWQEFWNIFDSTIHQNSALSDIDKFKYLKRYIDGDAKTTIEGYRVTSSNYSTVVEALKERFDNSEIAVFAHFENLLALPRADKDISLRQTYDSCEKHVRSLVALGLSEDTFGQVFTPIILSKLPRGVRIELHRRNESKPWKLSNLREYMRDEMKAREMSEAYMQTTPSSKQHSDNNSKSKFTSKPKTEKTNPPTQSSLSNQSKPVLNCSFCKGQHYADKCTKFKTVDERKAVLNGRCFKCLGEGHSAKKCERSKPCFYCKKDSHHSSLCFKKFDGCSKPHETTNLSNSNDQSQVPAAEATLLSAGSQVQMQMAVTRLQGRNGVVEARVFFDTGSTRSYITTSLLNKLDVPVSGVETISIAKFANRKRKTVQYKRASISIPTLDGDDVTISVLSTPVITCPIQKYPIPDVDKASISGLSMADTPSKVVQLVPIDILIGSDFYYDFIGCGQLKLPSGAMLLQSRLGYVVSGRMAVGSEQGETVLMFRQSADVGVVSNDVQKFWSLQDIGVKDNPYQNDDDLAISKFNETVKKIDGRYAVKFPWKDADPELPSNYGLAYGRLKSLLSRLRDSPDVMTTYNKTIQDQLEKGIVEPVDPNSPAKRVHYIPHHCVIRQQKTTTKLRIVYDASAKEGKGKNSINECLLRGPVLLQDLCGMLMRFRRSKIGLSSDVEKAFLQVSLQEDERDVTRFLWLKDVSKPLSADNLMILRFSRVPFGFVSSPFLLAGTVKHHLDQKDGSETATEVKDNIYVDNSLGGRDNIESAKDYFNESKLLFSEISMNIREWYSNSQEFIESLPENDRGKDICPKILGLPWNLQTDTLSCASGDSTAEVSTKRNLLHAVSTVFDPCGLVSPVTTKGKLLVQDSWKLKVGWDERLPDSILQEYQSLKLDLANIHTLQIPRYLDGFRGSDPVQYDIHCFCDASAKAYAAVCYVRIHLSNGVFQTYLVFSKTRLSPIKPITIPRLELMAVVIGVRVMAFVSAELRIPPVNSYLWSDSKCVLQWIKSSKLLPVFVQNQISEIKSTASHVVFRHIPTAENPADLPSRGTSVSELNESTLWWHGPKFLGQSETNWPDSSCIVDREFLVDAITLEVTAAVVEQSSPCIADVIDINRYSSFTKLLRVTAYVCRFIQLCRKSETFPSFLSKSELTKSEFLWVKHIQSSIPEDTMSSNSTLGRHLGLFRDGDGIIRCKGRLEHSTLPDDIKYPKLLPKKSKFTDLVIQYSHCQLLHDGPRQTLAQIRQEYWIPQGMSQVKRVLHHCLVCRKCETGPFSTPSSPPLPWYRVSDCAPFQHVGIDYLGPLFVKSEDSTDVPAKKVWICLFTCAVVRAIHLEVITDASTTQFLMALRRFCAAYGKPSTLVSDNAKQFVKAKKTLEFIISSDDVQTYAANQGIQWNFIPELSPWMGGFYERLVQSVKRPLRKTLGKHCLTLVQLQTIVAEVAAIINSRPLVSYDHGPNEHTLCPSDFLLKRGRTGLPDFKLNSDPTYSVNQDSTQSLISRWSKGQKILDSVWQCWRNEYLASLRERRPPKWNNRNSNNFSPCVGDVVLIKDNLPRCRWKMGKIQAVFSSNDGKIRSAAVRLHSGTIVKRPIKLLYPIEPQTFRDSDIQDSDSVPGQSTQKPKRSAAIAAKNRIQTILQLEETN